MYKFYSVRFKSNGKYYIGETINNSGKKFEQAFWDIHFENKGSIFPWDTRWDKEEGRWEKEFRRLVCDMGFKAAMSEIDVRVYGGAAMEKAVKESIDNFKPVKDLNLDFSFYERLKIILDLYNPALLPETLLICAAAVQFGSVLNMHANFGSDRTEQLTRDKVLNQILTPASLIKRDRRENKYIPQIWLNFELKKEDIYDENGDKIKGHQRKITSGNRVSLNTFEKLNRELPEVAQHKIKETTFESIRYQIEQYAKNMKIRSIQAKLVSKKLIELANSEEFKNKIMKKWLKTGLQTIENSIRKIVEEVNKQLKISFLTDKEAEVIASILREWVQKVDINKFLNSGNSSYLTDLHDKYKIKLVNYMKNNVFKDIPKDAEYTEKQTKTYKDKRGLDDESVKDKTLKTAKNKTVFNAWLPKTSEPYESKTLIAKTREKLPNSAFMRENWFNATIGHASMYGEQVSIWLGDEEPFSFYGDVITAFKDQPKNESEYKKIKIY